MSLPHSARAERRRAIASRLRAGDHPRKIASDFRVTLNLVYNAAKEYGIRRAENNLPRPNTLRILKELLDGRKAREIANDYGLSRQRVQAIKQRAEEAGFEF